jgi:hypothetical protein
MTLSEIQVTDDNYLSLTDMLRSKDGDFLLPIG